MIIAIDGPAGSGKSTTARRVAQALNILYLDTGAMYRALALKALRHHVDLQQAAALIELAQNTEIQLTYDAYALHVFLDHEDVTGEIRTPAVNQAVPLIAAIPAIRAQLVKIQQTFGGRQSLVAEGRDIGTVVFPAADLKIFMIANLAARAQRRFAELQAKNHPQSYESVLAELQQRDQLDAARAIGPLKKADDAIELDTSDLTIEQQVAFILKHARAIITGSRKRE